ncbi:MAG TPA: hypothetical protein VM582_03180, partial [Candidatus Thermoplasmatota archaeon]|nr:hypothetical protein [Candidatus Thermoplasmatota archaeon]
MTTRGWAIAICILLASPAIIGATPITTDSCAPSGDAGDDPANATPIASGAICVGYFEPGGADWYSIPSTAGNYFTVDLETDLQSDMVLCLRKPDLTAIRCSNRFVASTDTTGTHYVQTVLGEGDNYSFRVFTGAQNDCRSGRDAGWNAFFAVPATLNASCRADWTPGDQEDWFSYDVDYAGKLTTALIVAASNNVYYACLISPGGVQLGCANSGLARTEFQHDSYEFGRYHVAVRHSYSNLLASYAPNLTLAMFPANDCGSGLDAPGNASSALAVSRTAACTGGLFHVNDTDWFGVSANAGDAVRLRATAPAAMRLCATDAAEG